MISEEVSVYVKCYIFHTRPNIVILITVRVISNSCRHPSINVYIPSSISKSVEVQTGIFAHIYDESTSSVSNKEFILTI